MSKATGMGSRDVEKMVHGIELAIARLADELDDAGLIASMTANICKTRTIIIEPNSGTLSFWIGRESEDI